MRSRRALALLLVLVVAGCTPVRSQSYKLALYLDANGDRVLLSYTCEPSSVETIEVGSSSNPPDPWDPKNEPGLIFTPNSLETARSPSRINLDNPTLSGFSVRGMGLAPGPFWVRVRHASHGPLEEAAIVGTATKGYVETNQAVLDWGSTRQISEEDYWNRTKRTCKRG